MQLDLTFTKQFEDAYSEWLLSCRSRSFWWDVVRTTLSVCAVVKHVVDGHPSVALPFMIMAWVNAIESFVAYNCLGSWR